MRTITVISGKGGTGKTSITGALASILNEQAIVVDADVDAPDMEIILEPDNIMEKEFYGHPLAEIDKELCTQCLKCIPACPEDAIDDEIEVDPIMCNGCSVCEIICPVDAITLESRVAASYFTADTRFGYLVHSKLKPGAGNSGGLVTTLRQEAERISEDEQIPYILVDGSPGVGCPVIASISAADLVLLVVEPTLSAFDDMKRVIQLSRHFNVNPAVCINKASINENNVAKIREFCDDEGVNIISELAYNENFTKAMINRQTIVEYKQSIKEKMELLWQKIEKQISSN